MSKFLFEIGQRVTLPGVLEFQAMVMSADGVMGHAPQYRLRWLDKDGNVAEDVYRENDVERANPSPSEVEKLRREITDVRNELGCSEQMLAGARAEIDDLNAKEERRRKRRHKRTSKSKHRRK